jgi:hypothetical protein
VGASGLLNEYAGQMYVAWMAIPALGALLASARDSIFEWNEPPLVRVTKAVAGAVLGLAVFPVAVAAILLPAVVLIALFHVPPLAAFTKRLPITAEYLWEALGGAASVGMIGWLAWFGGRVGLRRRLPAPLQDVLDLALTAMMGVLLSTCGFLPLLPVGFAILAITDRWPVGVAGGLIGAVLGAAYGTIVAGATWLFLPD